ncbi:MAG: hypothetical protein ACJ74O_14760 [Frankiaceae bacterium]
MKPPAVRSAVAIPAQAAPSSLIKVPDSTRARCVACGSPKLTQIAMTLTDGSPVQFTSCRHCEHRRWIDGGHDGGHVLPVDSVLSKATKRT